MAISTRHCFCSLLRKCDSIRCYLLRPNKQNNVQYKKFSRSHVCAKYCPSLECGLNYLTNPHFNKGLAFSIRERQILRIQGLLAPGIRTIEDQLHIANINYDRYLNPLNQYMFLSHLHDHNQRLFYALLDTNIEKFLPIVYTPTVGLACMEYGYVYRKPKGLFISIKDKGRIYKVISNWPVDDVNVICVTDGERILGLGDLGAYAMGIPIGKLCLYTALAGVQPRTCLPITLDVGTNNKKLISDPIYIGLRQDRIRGEEYNEFVDEFMEACIRRYGRHVLIQFEDFALPNAQGLLKKYKDKYCVFNDDIQGTAAAVLAGIYGACKIQGGKVSDNTFFFFGAGASANGIGELLVNAMKEDGLSEEQARNKVFMFDINGLVTSKREGGVPAHAAGFGKTLPASKDLAKCIETVKATCLIGVSTVGGAFKPNILNQMAKNCERPIVFALSNPTKNAECTAQQAYDETEGRVIFASGSPFPPVKYKGKTYITGQGNNAYIFPGIGLGVVAVDASRVPDKMFLNSAKVVGHMITDEDLKNGCVYPSLKRIRKISLEIAKNIANVAYENKIAGVQRPSDMDDHISKQVFKFEYPRYDPELYEY